MSEHSSLIRVLTLTCLLIAAFDSHIGWPADAALSTPQEGTRGNEASFMMGADEFAQLKDGTQVILNGPGPIRGWAVGRLDKSLLDR